MRLRGEVGWPWGEIQCWTHTSGPWETGAKLHRRPKPKRCGARLLGLGKDWFRRSQCPDQSKRGCCLSLGSSVSPWLEGLETTPETPTTMNLQGLAPSARQGGTALAGSSCAWAPIPAGAAPKPVAARGFGLGRPQTAIAQRSAEGRVGDYLARRCARPSRRWDEG